MENSRTTGLDQKKLKFTSNQTSTNFKPRFSLRVSGTQNSTPINSGRDSISSLRRLIKKPSEKSLSPSQRLKSPQRASKNQYLRKSAMVTPVRPKSPSRNTNLTNEAESDRLSTCESLNERSTPKIPRVQECKNQSAIHKNSPLFSNQKSTSPRSDDSQSMSIPDSIDEQKQSLVLDLDETLIHAYNIKDQQVRFFTRPYCLEFLKNMSEFFEIVIFTAASKEYADSILDILDIGNCIKKRLYRQHMNQFNGVLVKDLTVLEKSLDKVILVDNLKANFAAQPENGYLIKNFFGESEDSELFKLEIVLREIINNPKVSVKSILKNKQKIIDRNSERINLFKLQLKEKKQTPFYSQSFISNQSNSSGNQGIIFENSSQSDKYTSLKKPRLSLSYTYTNCFNNNNNDQDNTSNSKVFDSITINQKPNNMQIKTNGSNPNLNKYQNMQNKGYKKYQYTQQIKEKQQTSQQQKKSINCKFTSYFSKRSAEEVANN